MPARTLLQTPAPAASVYPAHHPLHPMNHAPAAQPPTSSSGAMHHLPGGGDGVAGGGAGAGGNVGGCGLPPDTVTFILKNASKCCLLLGDWSSWRLLQALQKSPANRKGAPLTAKEPYKRALLTCSCRRHTFGTCCGCTGRTRAECGEHRCWECRRCLSRR